TAGRQRPRPYTTLAKARTVGAVRAPCAASPSPRCFTMPTRPILPGGSDTTTRKTNAPLRAWPRGQALRTVPAARVPEAAAQEPAAQEPRAEPARAQALHR